MALQVKKKNIAQAPTRSNPYLNKKNLPYQKGIIMEDGGLLSDYQTGGKTPIIVNNPKDPRLLAYKDSLNLHNLSKDVMKSFEAERINTYNQKHINQTQKEYSNNLLPFLEDFLKKSNKLSKYEEKTYSKIKPSVKSEIKDYNSYDDKMSTTIWNTYKKPVQPIIYKKPEPIQPVTTTKILEQVIQRLPVQPQLKEYSGNPVYANTPYSRGAGAVIGFENKGDTTYISPEDYERFAVPNYGKKVIESKKKIAEGGEIKPGQLSQSDIEKKLALEEVLRQQKLRNNQANISQYKPKKGDDERMLTNKEKYREEQSKPLNKLSRNSHVVTGGKNLADAADATMDVAAVAGAVTGVSGIGLNALRLGASGLNKAIGRNIASRAARNFASKASPYVNAVDELAAYAQMDPIGIMGNSLNKKLYNPQVALNTTNNTLTGVKRNLTNSAIEGTDLTLSSNNFNNIKSSSEEIVRGPIPNPYRGDAIDASIGGVGRELPPEMMPTLREDLSYRPTTPREKVWNSFFKEGYHPMPEKYIPKKAIGGMFNPFKEKIVPQEVSIEDDDYEDDIDDMEDDYVSQLSERDLEIENKSKEYKLLQKKALEKDFLISQLEKGRNEMESEQAAQALLGVNMYNYNGNDLDDAPYLGAGEKGKEIIGELTSVLGYTPKFNSIARTPEKQEQLIKQGVGVKNSFHLTGDAVDMKPTDWAKIPDIAKAKMKGKYDILSHANHVHIEPKTRFKVGGVYEGVDYKGLEELKKLGYKFEII